MQKIVIMVALLSLPMISNCRNPVSREGFSSEDSTEIGRLDAEIKSKQQQYSRLQQEIGVLTEKKSRLESAAHSRAASKQAQGPTE